ncbi:MAG: ATP-binding cassette domain-containing protein, partial [Oscillospiraceae bacterium]|nr:ATP-binding cassette domain-containing protein [Oscillospiraceae bacterium]
ARCFNYLEKPTDGDVLFEGVALGSLKPRKLYETRRCMGMIFQQFNLLMQRSVLRNVLFPMEIAGFKKADSVKRAKELLELVNLSDKLNAYPATLSGGQKQRVAIARAMALSPRVLICDEATSALDPETTRGILALLREINQATGVTVIIITHEMPVIESVCRRVAVLDGSRVAETGLVSEVFRNPKTDAAKALVYGDGRGESFIRKIEDAGLTVEEVFKRAGIEV